MLQNIFNKLVYFKNRIKLYFLVAVIAVLASFLIGKYNSGLSDYEVIYMDEIQESAIKLFYDYLWREQSLYYEIPEYEVLASLLKQKDIRENIFKDIYTTMINNHVNEWRYGKPIWSLSEFEKALFGVLKPIKVFDLLLFFISLLYLCFLPIALFESYYRIDAFTRKKDFQASLVGLIIRRIFLGFQFKRIKLANSIESLQKKIEDNAKKKSKSN